jgi:hypothetical protein
VVDATVAVDGFLPSLSAFRFTNSWPKQPVVQVPVPGFGPVVLGDASRGLCGGMTYTVRDLFEAGLPPPDSDEPPEAGSPLYRYIVRRLIQSWDVPRGVVRYYRLGSLPDGDVKRLLWLRRGTWRITVADEWSIVRRDLDEGRLSPLGIIGVHTSDPRQLGQNHQVLAYGYQQRGTTVTLRVYDPNTPRKRADEVTVSFDVAHPDRPSPIDHTIAIGKRPVRAFFRTRYRWKDPRDAG